MDADNPPKGVELCAGRTLQTSEPSGAGRCGCRLLRPRARMVAASEQGGPASEAGLLSGDIVVRLDGVAVTGVDDLIRLLNAERIGRDVTVEVLRLGRLREFTLRPLERRGGVVSGK